METENKNTFVTSRGYKVAFKPIPVLLQKVTQLFQLPSPPTYTPPTAPGFVPQPEPHYHRVVTVKETGEDGIEREVEREQTSLETPEEWSEWNAYQKELAQRSVEIFQAQVRACLMEGIEILERPTRNWEKRQQMLGIAIPNDPDEKELHFLETELAASAEDAVAIVIGVSRASGIDEEVVALLENSFRSAVGQGGALDAANGHAAAHDTTTSNMAGEFAV